jgi:hypothetical protein
MINKNCETRVSVWVPETPHTSRDPLVLVEIRRVLTSSGW